MSITSHNWFFILTNYSEQDVEYLMGDLRGVRYIVFQREIGESGGKYLIGYLELETNKSISFLKRINERAYWAQRRGTQQLAIDYCKKEDKREPGTEPFERGNKANPRGRPSKRNNN